jgi:hypothetical protein
VPRASATLSVFSMSHVTLSRCIRPRTAHDAPPSSDASSIAASRVVSPQSPWLSVHTGSSHVLCCAPPSPYVRTTSTLRRQ